MATFDPAKTAFSRVFIIEGQAGPENEPDYQSCLKAGSFDRSYGDTEPIQCPDPNNWGRFIEVGQIQGAIERASSTLTGRYAADLASVLLELARRRCMVDIQVNMGKCTNPKLYDVFTKKFIWENVNLSNFSTEDLGALSSDENAPVNEASDLSIGEAYEVLQLTLQERAPDTVEERVVDVVICSQISCGECEDPDTGCDKIYALHGGVLASPGAVPDVIFSLDKGLTWSLNQITSLLPNESANALACVQDYVVVVSHDSCSLHYKTQEDVDDGVVGGWTEVATGFVADRCPLDIWSVGTGAFIVGEGGYVYWTTDPVLGVSVLDAGVATTNNLNAVHAMDDEHAVAVGDSDTVIYTTNGVNWIAASATGSGSNLIAVWMWSENVWWIGTDGGELYYTTDQGVNWTAKALPGVGISEVDDIAFSSKSVGYASGARAAGAAGMAWRTYNGGYTWIRLPEGTGSLPDSDTLDALAACINDENFVVFVGEVDANDGVIIVGED